MPQKHSPLRRNHGINLRALALAALFEGDFSIDWLQALEPIKASDILKTLEKGIQHGLLRQKETGTYNFRYSHPERQPELMDVFSPGEREKLRRCIVDMMFAEISDETHMIKAAAAQLRHLRNDEEDCRWLLKAGDIYRKENQPVKALQYYEKIFSDMGKKKGDTAKSLYIDAAIGYSKVTASTHEAKSVIAVLKKAMQKSLNLDNKIQQSLLEMHLAKNEWTRNRLDAAMNHYDRGWALAREIDDPRLNRSVNAFSTFFPYWLGRFDEAVENYEKLVPEVDRHPQGRFPLMASVAIGVCYALTGQVGQGLGMLQAIHNHSRQIGDDQIMLVTNHGLGWVFIEIGRADEALKIIEEVRGVRGEVPGILHESALLYSLANAHNLTGNKKKSVRYMKALMKLRKENEINLFMSPSLLEICWLMDEGSYPRIQGLNLKQEISRAMRSRNVWVKGVACRYKALLQRRKGLPGREVIKSLKDSIVWLEQSGHKFELARTKLEIGRQFLHIGKESEARKEVQEATGMLAPIDESLIPDDLRYLSKDFRSEENLLEEIMTTGQEIVTIRDAKTMAQKIISTVNRITGAERGAIFLCDKKTGSPDPVLRAARNLMAEDIDHPGFARSMELINKVIDTGNGRILEMDEQKNSLPVSVGAIRSCICVPLKLRGDIIGALYHDNCFLPTVFMESDLRTLNFFAAQAAIALDNAKAYDEIREINRMLREEKQYIEEQHLESHHYEDVIGRSPAFLKTLELVERVSDSETTVLILGETGVGKEIIARTIHRNSPRKNKPFIRVNCSALPESIITSELFGHEKGAFTGAVKQRLGRFELADGGTLFLDEIGEIPLDVQVRLLRVLQTKEFERVGGRETLKSDFRLIAATNRDLEQAVKANKFRQDLFYRLNVFPIQVPALRKRKEDIPLLADHFLKLFAGRISTPVNLISDGEMEKLIQYDWPGNVRELENIIERGLILSNGRRFIVPELDHSGRKASSDSGILTLEENERRMILKALEKTNGKVRGKGGAAELLDINRSTLQSRMKKLGIRKNNASWSST